MFKIFNTLNREKDVFKPINNKRVGLYTCGPTVYWFVHIGNLRTYIFEDILKRALYYNKYNVKHVMNITDVGHLTSDADTGEDKIEKGAKREKKTAWQLADFYTKEFQKDLKHLNILPPNKWIRATDTIKDQISFIKKLEEKGFTYIIPDGVYFNTSKLKIYGRLWGKKRRKIKPGVRIEVVQGKKNPTDFALWKLTPPGINRQMEWESPWGKGFPGWHTECVVMAIKGLGIPFDIHCGGIDHIFIHHTNEIVQGEALFRKILANYWLHGEFLVLKKERMGKSKGNITTLRNIVAKEINPLAFRYLCLTSHYRSKLTFSWESLKAADNALDKLYEKTSEILSEINLSLIRQDVIKKYQENFLKFINDDLNIPKAIALMWKVIKDKHLFDAEKYKLLLDFDEVFGLSLRNIKKIKISTKIKKLLIQREQCRQQKKWDMADKMRKKIKEQGYIIEDTKDGSKLKKL